MSVAHSAILSSNFGKTSLLVSVVAARKRCVILVSIWGAPNGVPSATSALAIQPQNNRLPRRSFSGGGGLCCSRRYLKMDRQKPGRIGVLACTARPVRRLVRRRHREGGSLCVGGSWMLMLVRQLPDQRTGEGPPMSSPPLKRTGRLRRGRRLFAQQGTQSHHSTIPVFQHFVEVIGKRAARGAGNKRGGNLERNNGMVKS